MKTNFKKLALLFLGLLVFAFLLLHMGDFWYKMKFTDQLAMLSYEGFDYQCKDLYTRVNAAFHEVWIVIAYLIGVLALGVHLWHGIDSSFQTFGLHHMKFGGAFKTFGRVYTVIICLGFAIIPIIFLIFR